MKQTIDDVFDLLVEDEQLLRLVYHLPKLYGVRPDPLDPSLPNMLDMAVDKRWDIIDKRILQSSKADDLVDNPICRLYVHLGNRLPNSSGSFKVATQDIHIDVLAHEVYEIDSRIARISDRLNELLIHNRITGLGKVEYVRGLPHPAPKNYSGYRHTYKVWNMKYDNRN
ncbi:hypothetical protein FZC83_02375 [Rossellomorea marisflavi]|uniref:Uncharacterized protein n=1 Tax=Rossellomorea marisflavi TaxID=189381 RepID=A0A5D4RZQ1_9BACI|nr:hypothetical protein [Rossellomorea marisflavi]TYS56440.1 hypothetical protein FZC83_02375 [Rossellomorea marisflavi]